MQHHTRSLWLALLVSCTPKADPGLETGSEGGSSGAESTTGGATGEPTTGEPTTGEPTTTQTPATTSAGTDSSAGDVTASSSAGDTTTGDGTTTTGTSTGGTDDTGDPPDTTGGEACVDAKEASNDWTLEVPPALVGEAFAVDCTLITVNKQGLEHVLGFDCMVEGEPQKIVVRYQIGPDLDIPWFVGTKMRIDYRFEQPFWKNEWLAVAEDNALYLGAVRADSLVPPGVTAEEFYRREITVHAPCDPVPDACGMRQALALGFIEVADGRDILELVKSGEFEGIGVFIKDLVFLEHASRVLEPATCDDVPPRWFDAMIISDVSGA